MTSYSSVVETTTVTTDCTIVAIIFILFFLCLKYECMILFMILGRNEVQINKKM